MGYQINLTCKQTKWMLFMLLKSPPDWELRTQTFRKSRPTCASCLFFGVLPKLTLWSDLHEPELSAEANTGPFAWVGKWDNLWYLYLCMLCILLTDWGMQLNIFINTDSDFFPKKDWLLCKGVSLTEQVELCYSIWSIFEWCCGLILD